MRLFGSRNKSNQTQNKIEAHAQTVETILKAIGIERPEDVRVPIEEGYSWSFKRGSAVIEIYLAEENDNGYLQLLAPIMHLPLHGILPLYRHLLELNLQLTNAALGVHKDVVYVFYERPLDGLDPGEASTIISTIAHYADELDDKLVKEFGGRQYSQV